MKDGIIHMLIKNEGIFMTNKSTNKHYSLNTVTFKNCPKDVVSDFKADLKDLLNGQERDIEQQILLFAEKFPPSMFFITYHLFLYEIKLGNIKQARTYLIKAIRAFTDLKIRGSINHLHFYLNELLPVEEQFREILSLGSMVSIERELKKMCSALNENKWINKLLEDELNLRNPFISTDQKGRIGNVDFTSSEPFIAMNIRIRNIYALSDMLNFKPIDFSSFDKWRRILRNIGYTFAKERLDSLENFAQAFEGLILLQKYKSLDQLREDEQKNLLKKIALIGMPTSAPGSVIDSESRLLLRRDIVEALKNEFRHSLKAVGFSKKKKQQEILHEGASEYELILSGRRKKFLSSQKADFIRNRKGTGANNEIFIDDERKDVFFNKNFLKDFRHQSYALLLHFVKNDGVGGNALQVYEDVWGDRNAAEENIEGAVYQAMRRFRKKVKKNMLGDVPWSLNNHYSISKTYIMKPRPRYCILMKIKKEKKEEDS